MVEPEVPLKKKDQVALDEEMARNLEAQLQAELIEEERLARQKEEEATIALIESWDNIQAMMEADFELSFSGYKQRTGIGRMGYFKLIRADGSSKRYSSMIKMLQGIDREDLRPSGSCSKLNMRIPGRGLKDFKMILEFTNRLCPVTILNTLDPLGKFDEKADEGFFVGYFINRVTTAQYKVTTAITTAGRINAVRDEIKDISEKR
ncbi:hypothetical protein Tco_0982020 [Tanacetum coccineum]